MSQWDRFSNAALRAVACVRFRNPTSNKRLGVAVPVFSIAALFALQRTSAWRRFRKSTKRRGIIFQVHICDAVRLHVRTCVPTLYPRCDQILLTPL